MLSSINYSYLADLASSGDQEVKAGITTQPAIQASQDDRKNIDSLTTEGINPLSE